MDGMRSSSILTISASARVSALFPVVFESMPGIVGIRNYILPSAEQEQEWDDNLQTNIVVNEMCI